MEEGWAWVAVAAGWDLAVAAGWDLAAVEGWAWVAVAAEVMATAAMAGASTYRDW